MEQKDTNTNNKTTKKTNRIPKKALGRGLQEIMAEQSRLDDGFNEIPEHVKAARIGAAILELIDIVEAKYHPVIFKSVAAYRAVANEETTEEIGRKLTQLDHHRQKREKDSHKPKRRWYFLFLR